MGRALPHQNAPWRVIPSRGGADSMADGRDDIEHIHDQTLAAVAGMINGASLIE
jgi:hypothetical protein